MGFELIFNFNIFTKKVSWHHFIRKTFQDDAIKRNCLCVEFLKSNPLYFNIGSYE